MGHDWGANTAWAAAEMHPDRFSAVAALSVPYRPRPPHPLPTVLRAQAGDRFNSEGDRRRPGPPPTARALPGTALSRWVAAASRSPHS
ncbi:alpha/beta fold hydrolase [Nocardia sp. GP40]|uniref:alpha/beta fold hydrolase n=1 Tax=Nocardia sp. GP40 TaxID=3156268 RepID=UPI003D1BBD13